MNEILLRVELHDEDQARDVLTRYAHPWIKEQLRQGRELVGEFRLLEDDITEKQRNYLHGVVLTEAALYGRPRGMQYEMKVWKEMFRAELLGFKVVTTVDPRTGRKTRRRHRISTEDLGVRGMAEYIDKVIAILATEFNVVVSEPLPPELRPGRRKRTAAEMADQSTGEILEGTAA